MGRYYQLSKRITEDNAERILEEILKLENIEKAFFDEDYAGITIFIKGGTCSSVMDRAVNIFGREGGAELSFCRFIPD